jgi:hypothetical protein
MSGRGKASVVVKAPVAAEVPPAVAEEPKAKAPEAMDPAVLANALAAAMFEILSLRKELDEIRKQQLAEPVKPKKKSSSKPGLSEEDLKKVRSENGKRLAAWRKQQKEAKGASEAESKSDSEQNSTKSDQE